MQRKILAALVALGALAIGTGHATRAADGVAPVASTLDARFVDAIKDATKAYAQLGRVDDEGHWAPELCRAPQPSVPRLGDETGHSKIYCVYAKDRSDYLGGESRVGQVVIKESFAPREVERTCRLAPPRDSVEKNGKLYVAGERRDLFVILRLDASTPGTDEGWVYGTVTPAGEVTAAGRVASCMHCHELAKHDRLFGLEK